MSTAPYCTVLYCTALFCSHTLSVLHCTTLMRYRYCLQRYATLAVRYWCNMSATRTVLYVVAC